MLFPQDVLSFWFGPNGPINLKNAQSIWFECTEQDDEEIRKKFLTTYDLATVGELDKNKEHSDGCLALIVTLDQFPRHIFRGSSQSFESDEQALSYARWAIENRFDETYSPLARVFIYLPFEHSENLKDQQRCLELMHALPDYSYKSENIRFASRHLEIIERFGRFPHRNKILGRDSTREEIMFLKEPDSSFIWPKNWNCNESVR